MCCLIDLAPESDVRSAFWIDCLIMQNEENISRTTQTGQNKSIEPTARSLRKRGWQLYWFQFCPGSCAIVFLDQSKRWGNQNQCN